jgi:hypothetical protein
MPRAWSLSRVSGSAMIFTVSRLSLSMTAPEAHRHEHAPPCRDVEARKTGLFHGRNIEKERCTLRRCDREGAYFSLPYDRKSARRRNEAHRNSTAYHIGDDERGASERHLLHIDMRHGIE